MDIFRDKLVSAITLRESENFEEARQLLLEVHTALPDDPQVNYQRAWIHDLLGLEREAIPFYENAIQTGLGGDLKSALLGMEAPTVVLGNIESPLKYFSTRLICFQAARNLMFFSEWLITILGNIRKQ